MIYDPVGFEEPICQGDIFKNIPRVDLSFSSMPVVESGDDEEAFREIDWRDIVNGSDQLEPVTALLPIKPVMAIVITQNCDAARGEYISLCEIGEYLSVTGQGQPKDDKGWQSLIMKLSRSNNRFFYLPEDSAKGLKRRYAADFRVIIRVRRADLERHKDYRIARLNKVANEHFREALAHFFRRYAYNEWYPLTPKEFESYLSQIKDEAEKANIKAYDWQTIVPTKSDP